MMDLDANIYVSVAFGVAILVYLWRLQRDMHQELSGLRERMARLEGLFEGFTKRERTGD